MNQGPESLIRCYELEVLFAEKCRQASSILHSRGVSSAVRTLEEKLESKNSVMLGFRQAVEGFYDGQVPSTVFKEEQANSWSKVSSDSDFVSILTDLIEAEEEVIAEHYRFLDSLGEDEENTFDLVSALLIEKESLGRQLGRLRKVLVPLQAVPQEPSRRVIV